MRARSSVASSSVIARMSRVVGGSGARRTSARPESVSVNTTLRPSTGERTRRTRRRATSRPTIVETALCPVWARAARSRTDDPVADSSCWSRKSWALVTPVRSSIARADCPNAPTRDRKRWSTAASESLRDRSLRSRGMAKCDRHGTRCLSRCAATAHRQSHYCAARKLAAPAVISNSSRRFFAYASSVSPSAAGRSRP